MLYTLSDKQGNVGSLLFGDSTEIQFNDDLEPARLPSMLYALYASGKRSINVGRVDKMFSQILLAFSATVGAKDPYTNGHAMRVADYSREIAKRAGFDRIDQKNIYAAGLLHDIGKIGIPDNILNKQTIGFIFQGNNPAASGIQITL